MPIFRGGKVWRIIRHESRNACPYPAIWHKPRAARNTAVHGCAVQEVRAAHRPAFCVLPVLRVPTAGGPFLVSRSGVDRCLRVVCHWTICVAAGVAVFAHESDGEVDLHRRNSRIHSDHGVLPFQVIATTWSVFSDLGEVMQL